MYCAVECVYLGDSVPSLVVMLCICYVQWTANSGLFVRHNFVIRKESTVIINTVLSSSTRGGCICGILWYYNTPHILIQTSNTCIQFPRFFLLKSQGLRSVQNLTQPLDARVTQG